MDPLNKISLTPLKVISNTKGDIYHGLKRSDYSYSGFGEAYFSFINQGEIKGWKRHKEMIMNIVVPVGKIRFVLFDDRNDSKLVNTYSEFILSQENYKRLTVPAMVWMAFQGIGNSNNLLLNIANIEHLPSESENKDLSEFDFIW
jgi:dTDP-4-dehydrorhamnose 3,5-epimerase